MKRISFACLLFAAPALAQQAPSPDVQALDALLHQAVEREAGATIAIVRMQGQIAGLQGEVALLKAAAAKVAESAPAAPPVSP